MIALLQKLKAAETLAQLQHLEAKSHLSHSELHKHDKCIASLIAIGSPAVPLLVRSLAGVRDIHPGASIPMILQQIGDPAVPCLAKAMHDRDSHLRHAAISLLGRIATPAAVCALDDQTVDLMDMEALQHAQLAARQHGQPEGATDLLDASETASSGTSWLARDDSLD